jgi:hypothetical protein
MKTNTVLRFTTIILLAVILSGCAGAGVLGGPLPPPGQLYLAQPGTTLYWMQQSAQGAVNTWRLTNGNGGWLLVWGQQNGYGFTLIKEAGVQGMGAVIDWAEATGGKGNVANYKDMRSFLNYMETQGWKAVPAAQFPIALREAISDAYATLTTAGSVVSQMGSTLISIFVVPVGAIPSCPPNFPCTYQEYQ